MLNGTNRKPMPSACAMRMNIRCLKVDVRRNVARIQQRASEHQEAERDQKRVCTRGSTRFDERE